MILKPIEISETIYKHDVRTESIDVRTECIELGTYRNTLHVTTIEGCSKSSKCRAQLKTIGEHHEPADTELIPE